LNFSVIVHYFNNFTAAHCIQPKGVSEPLHASKLRIYLGRTDFSDPNERNFVTRKGYDIKVHPDWEIYTKKYDADIAIIKWGEWVDYTEFIQPICLPSSAQSTINIRGTVVGYGFTENTQGKQIEKLSKFLEIPTVSQESCLFSHPTFHYIASPRTFCAGERGKIPCKIILIFI
jgi:hypothetical protein